MKEYCVDLKIATELKENGFPEESHHKHVYRGKYRLVGATNCIYKTFSSAPTSEEILKELPTLIKIKKIFYSFYITTTSHRTYCVYYKSISVKKPNLKTGFITNDKLSNALAKLWLQLKKEGYINGKTILG